MRENIILARCFYDKIRCICYWCCGWRSNSCLGKIKKVCSKVISAGMQLKDDAASFVETVKEDAEDIKAEAAYNKNAAKANA